MNSVASPPSASYRQPHFGGRASTAAGGSSRPHYDTRVVVPRGGGRVFRPPPTVRPPRFVNMMNQQRSPPTSIEAPAAGGGEGGRDQADGGDGQWKEVRPRHSHRHNRRADEVRTTVFRKSDSHNYEMKQQQQRYAAPGSQYSGRRSYEGSYRSGNPAQPPPLARPQRRPGSTSSNEDPSSPGGNLNQQRRSPHLSPRVEFDFSTLPPQYSPPPQEDLRQEIERRKQQRTAAFLREQEADLREKQRQDQQRKEVRLEQERLDAGLSVQPDVLTWLRKEWGKVAKQLESASLTWPATVKYYKCA